MLDTYMKLRQNGIVSLMIRPAVFLAGGRAYMKLHLTNAEVGMWNAEGWSRYALSLLLNKEAVIFEDLAALRSLMKPHQVKSEPQNRRISNIEGWVRFAQSFFIK